MSYLGTPAACVATEMKGSTGGRVWSINVLILCLLVLVLFNAQSTSIVKRKISACAPGDSPISLPYTKRTDRLHAHISLLHDSDEYMCIR